MLLVKLVREVWMYWRLYYNRLDTCICTCTVKYFFSRELYFAKVAQILICGSYFCNND